MASMSNQAGRLQALGISFTTLSSWNKNCAKLFVAENVQVRQHFERVKLNDILIRFQLRGPDQGLDDEPKKQTDEPIALLLKPEFDHIPTEQIRVTHLDWKQFCANILKYCGVAFDNIRDEMGWIQDPPREGMVRKFVPIFSELTFHNAIGVMQNASTSRTKYFYIYMFSPQPREPVFKRSRRAPNAVLAPGSDKSVNITQTQSNPEPTTPSSD